MTETVLPYVCVMHAEFDLSLSPKRRYKMAQHMRRYALRYGKDILSSTVMIGTLEGVRFYAN